MLVLLGKRQVLLRDLLLHRQRQALLRWVQLLRYQLGDRLRDR